MHDFSGHPEGSDYTSIQKSLGIFPNASNQKSLDPSLQDLQPPDNNKAMPQAPLQPFAGNEHILNDAHHLPFHFVDYLELVDWTGRCLRSDKRGVIDKSLPPLLQGLHITSEQWLKTSGHIQRDNYRAIGPIEKLEQLCEKLGRRWLQGKMAFYELYSMSSTA